MRASPTRYNDGAPANWSAIIVIRRRAQGSLDLRRPAAAGSSAPLPIHNYLMTVQAKSTSSFVVVDDSADASALKGAVVALGNFDGVHRGHREVIGTATGRARVLGRPSAALTFEPHPRAFFRPEEPFFRLTDKVN